VGETDVTLIPLQELEARQSETARTLAGLRGQAEALGSRAGDRLEEAGRLPIQRRNEKVLDENNFARFTQDWVPTDQLIADLGSKAAKSKPCEEDR
jgi:hypothetical protein